MSLIEEYRTLYELNRGYGSSSIKRLPFILPYVLQAKVRSLIDYGCGRSELGDRLAALAGCSVRRYDPALPEFSDRPTGRFDLLVCVDVLEHVPEAELDALLLEVASLSDKALIIIDSRPSHTLLRDGRNAHVTLRPADWWRAKLACYYPIVNYISVRRRPASFRTWNIGPIDRTRVKASTAYLNVRRALSRAAARALRIFDK